MATLAEIAEAQRVAAEQEARRIQADAEASERERGELLRQQYAGGKETPEMARLSEKLRWLHDLLGGRWALPSDMAIPSHDSGEHAAAFDAARQAVAGVVLPRIAEAEAEYAEAERARDRFIRGRR
jgi:hypothetical protein